MTDAKPRAKRKPDRSQFIPPPLLRRKISWGHCEKCRTLVGRGLDADVLAFSATVAAMPLSLFGESQALRLEARVGTYDVESKQLHRRDEWARRARPAGALNLVLADHWCWIDWPETWRQRERILAVKPYVVPDEPPF